MADQSHHSPIDRVAQTPRQITPPVGFQNWRRLLFLHWPVSVGRLRPLVPSQLKIDTFDGVAYIGLVAFAMIGVRPAYLPSFFGLKLLETNVRTYVHLDGVGPGVHFLSLDAASSIAVIAARLQWGLPYFLARMSSARRGDIVSYVSSRHWRGRPSISAKYRIGRPIGSAQPGTLDAFLVDRYLLCVRRGGLLYSGQVHHPPYPLWSVSLLSCEESLIAAVGVRRPQGPPPLVHYSPGVDVEIFPPRPLA